jgi:membrane-associated HD superfamily phosphohydrolase
MSATTNANLIPVDKVDYLDQDAQVRGQNYVCLSFLSPEDVIVRREAFFFQRFLSAVGQDVVNLLDGIAAKFGPNDPNVVETVSILKERHKYLVSDQAMDEEYRFYVEKKEKELSKEFDEQVQFRTSIRGIKVRGVYETLAEAMNRVESIKRVDPKFNVYVAEVGCWCPWSPNPDDIQDVKYAETQLNTLMKSYKDNLSKRDEYYQNRKETLLKAIAENQEALTKSNKVLGTPAEASPGFGLSEEGDAALIEDITQQLQIQQPHCVMSLESQPAVIASETQRPTVEVSEVSEVAQSGKAAEEDVVPTSI